MASVSFIMITDVNNIVKGQKGQSSALFVCQLITHHYKSEYQPIYMLLHER